MWLEPLISTQIDTNKTIVLNDKGIDCAKECPCGGPVIPVPDQWLEVMVTGGFKVWHIIFIIIAFLITLTVGFCCFYKCRIPRTKQEIEADLMRSKLTSKFLTSLQELQNEPTSYIDALKKVQEIEEKLEQDGSRELGARKRMGWLKGLKGKEDKEPSSNDPMKDKDNKDDNAILNGNPTLDNGLLLSASVDGTKVIAEPETATQIVGDMVNPIDTPALPDSVVVNMEKSEKTGEMLDKIVEREAAGKTGQQQAKTRRRRKPNLPRTKRARERSDIVDPEQNLLPELPAIPKETTPPQSVSLTITGENPTKIKTMRAKPHTATIAHKHKQVDSDHQEPRARSRDRRKKLTSINVANEKVE